MNLVVAQLGDPLWFPVDLDLRAAQFRFLDLDPAVLESSAFLDTRIKAPLERALAVSASEVAKAAPAIDAAAPPAFLFHTSFCCSTLLARALHVPGHSVALKEPLVLRRLGDARDAGFDTAPMTSLALRLLARPWRAGERVVIKPTHAALNIAGEMLAAAPTARAVLIYGTLEDFLISNLKKPAATQQKVPELAERALRASGLHQRLDPQALAPPDFLGAVALQWCAQIELCTLILAGPGGARVRPVREVDLLADVGARVRDCAQWLGLDLPQDALAARLEAVTTRHAKVPDAAYDADRRAGDAAKVRSMFGADIDAALRWSERMVQPALSATPL